MWLFGGLTCVWILAVVGVAVVYIGMIRTKTYYGIQPDEYHTFDKEALKNYWDTGKRWRARKRSRAILTAIPIFIVGWFVVFFMSFLKTGPAHIQATSTPIPTPIVQTITPG
jgi:hypothetical protein